MTSPETTTMAGRWFFELSPGHIPDLVRITAETSPEDLVDLYDLSKLHNDPTVAVEFESQARILLDQGLISESIGDAILPQVGIN